MAFLEVLSRHKQESVDSLPIDSFRDLSPPPEERLRKAKEARKLQLQRYQQREADHELESRSPQGDGGGGNCKKVSFDAKERLRDAVMRSDLEEGEGRLASYMNIWLH
jgi:hypothetical protein